MSARLPDDPVAERVLAAVAALNTQGAANAIEVIEDIWDPTCARVIRAATQVPDLIYEERLNSVALAAEVPRTLLDTWIGSCPVLWDSSGSWRALVRAAAERRRRALAMAEEFEQLVGAPPVFEAAR